MEVRRATAEDVPQVVETGRRFMAGSPYWLSIRDNPEQMAQLATWLIGAETGAVWVLARDGQVKGILGAICYPHPFDGELTASEMFWWVDPDVRGHGLRLLRQFEAWADERQAYRMVLVAPTAETEALYGKLGYARTEVSYERTR